MAIPFGLTGRYVPYSFQIPIHRCAPRCCRRTFRWGVGGRSVQGAHLATHAPSGGALVGGPSGQPNTVNSEIKENVDFTRSLVVEPDAVTTLYIAAHEDVGGSFRAPTLLPTHLPVGHRWAVRQQPNTVNLGNKRERGFYAQPCC